MSWKPMSCVLTSIAMMILTSCNVVMGTPKPAKTNTPTTDPQALINQAVAETMAAQTQIALSVQQTLAAMVTDTLQFTFTPSVTLTPSLTPSTTPSLTPETPHVSVTVDTNCRTGPGTVYDKLGVLLVGQSAEVVGRSHNSDNWIIKLPSNPAITCWLWAYYATVTGNTSGLPVYPTPPTPTPAISFTVAYFSTEFCGGFWGIELQITNTGIITWESNRITATDLVTSETKTVDRNSFPNLSGCVVASADDNLEPGEIGITTTAGFSANPASHNMTATIRVCSLDGLAGTCLDKTITVS
ncbi:MAG: hypothetical protein HY781_02370 [Chloroflexi bacterium]|nr:hypothetical protein [Chloroflexota bacterium]